MGSAALALLAACEQTGSKWSDFGGSPPRTVVQQQHNEPDPVPSYTYVKQKTVECPACNGTGFYIDPYDDENESGICPRCKGKRYFTVY